MSHAFFGTGALILRVLLAFILGRACLHKWRALPHFVQQLRAYRLVPAALTSPVAMALALAETITAVTLLNPMWALPALAAASLFASYGAAMAINLLRGRSDVDCGCGGPLAARRTIDWTLVVRNAGLTMLALLALLAFSTQAPARDASLFLVIVPASAAALLLYETAEQALANRQRVLAWKR
jgi:hypothetical protein